MGETDEIDVQIGTACMQEITQALQKHGCILEVLVSFSSIRGPSFQIVARPQKNIVVADKMPKLGDN
jgi:hypothetical protein